MLSPSQTSSPRGCQADGSYAQELRQRSSSRLIQSAEQIVGAFTTLLGEMDRRSQQRYNELKNGHMELKTDFTVDHSNLKDVLARFELLSERLGECLASNKRVQENHDHILWLGHRLKTGEDRYDSFCHRFAALENGMAQFDQRMRQIEADRDKYLCKETIDALEIAHTQGAESRLRIVAQSIRADLAAQREELNRMKEDVQKLNMRTPSIGKADSVDAVIDARLSEMKERMRTTRRNHALPNSLQEQTRVEIESIEPQFASPEDELINLSQQASTQRSQDVRDVRAELEHIKALVHQIQTTQEGTSIEMIHKAAHTDVIRGLCRKVRGYNSSQQRHDEVEEIFAAFLDNAEFVDRLQPHVRSSKNSMKQSIDDRRDSRIANVAGEVGKPDFPVDMVHDDAPTNNVSFDKNDSLTLGLHLEVPASNQRESLRQRTPVMADDLSSEDEIAVKRARLR